MVICETPFYAGGAQPGSLGLAMGGAGGSCVLSEGELSKSNRASSVFEFASRAVRCWVVPPALRKRFSMSASSAVWSPTVCDA